MDLANYIDHTNLDPSARTDDILRLCDEASEWQFASVCVNPCYVALASERLRGKDVKVCSVVGFPLGANTMSSKAYEAEKAYLDGAAEIDMVMNISHAKNGSYDLLREDIAGVVRSVPHCTVKVILETCLLEDDEILKACSEAVKAGAHFLKTSTGFSSGGATVRHVELIRDCLPPQIGVKASGGIRDRESAEVMIKAGANRLGTSRSVLICKTVSG
ncbi:MAG: deoxyribose-phosphate aldolase [Negativicutes bacterium]|jgi:deoxyribose-phosphate aldolase|nr:deoxyribose-phosphate aldolase [Synergistaceae bacterium]NCB98991.1 deoxyribose-phosphate aldolase [Bacteroidia bacterium]NCD10880.1 deoxyribose-phosphate aldolase [Negativicutes bacterium]